MQNKQYELCLDVLRKLEAAGVLQNLVLVAALVLDLLNKKKEIQLARDLLAKFPPTWKKRILATLRREHLEALVELLK